MPARTYLITGASSGIGAQFARSYAKRGNNLILVARRLDRLEALAAELRVAHGVTVTCLNADLSDRAQVNGLVSRIRKMNFRPDGLINNAGYSLAHTFAATTAKQQLNFIEVCVAAPTLLARELLDHMLAQGYGRIINVSSMVAFSPGASGHTLYPAAKAYMLKFSRSLAAEVAGRGIKVTALCPGSTESEFQHSNGMDAVLKSHPARFVQTAEAVVEAAIRANEAGREVIVTGWTNKLAVFLMTYLPDGLITPLIRWGAKNINSKTSMTITATESQHYDLIIIGSGAGGGTLAYALANTGKQILILERGQELPVEPQNWDSKAVFVDHRYRTSEQWVDKDNHPFTPNTNYWVGGNTTFYGAALMRMKKRDFEAVEHSDGLSPAWPLSYTDFAPWYEQAEALWRVHGERGIDPNDLPDDPPFPYPPLIDDPGVAKLKQHFQDLGWHPSPLPLGINRDDAHPLTSHCVRCTTCGGYPCLLKAKSDARSIVIDPIRNLSNVTILTGHRVKHIEAHDKAVTGVVTETNDGALQTFTGDLYALAAGAANSAAILLQSATAAHPNGLANSSGLVGRNYMFHTTSAVISIMADRFDSTFPKIFAVNDFYFGDKDYPYPMGQIQLLEYMSGQTLEGQISDILPPPLIPDFLSDDIARHMVAFLTMTEDLPREENRVNVTDTGQIRLTYTPNNLPAHLKLTQKLEQALKSFSLRQHTLFEPHFQIDSLLPLYGTAHQCGTLRFGRDPSTSVLDVNCKAHDLDNLYVVDTSFFVSSSSVNPTLTTVANALRVGEHLKERMA